MSEKIPVLTDKELEQFFKQNAVVIILNGDSTNMILKVLPEVIDSAEPELYWKQESEAKSYEVTTNAQKIRILMSMRSPHEDSIRVNDGVAKQLGFLKKGGVL